MNSKTPCRCCGEKVTQLVKQFDKDHGYVCPDCCEFMEYSELELATVGVRGAEPNPVRFQPQPKTP